MYPVNAVTAVHVVAGCVLEQDPEVLSHLYDPMKSATWATQLANHIVHLLKIRHGWAACKPGLGLAVTNGVCKEHELGWIRALSANQVANPPQLCATNPDPQGFCGGNQSMQLLSGVVIKQGDPFHAAQAAVMEHLQAV